MNTLKMAKIEPMLTNSCENENYNKQVISTKYFIGRKCC